MKKILAATVALIVFAVATHALHSPQTIEPSDILFSVPTLSEDPAPLAPFESFASTVETTTLSFHEDEWAQIEFFPKSRFYEIQQVMKEFKIFEATQRAGGGWRQVYARKVHTTPVLVGAQLLMQLEAALGTKKGASPIIESGGNAPSRVSNGFTFRIGSGLTLYGYTDAIGNIPVLGAIVDTSSDGSALIEAFIKLARSNGLILVDWRAQQVLVSVSEFGKVDLWQP